MNKELENKLFEKYPKIFSEKDLPLTESLMRFGFECGDGWYNLIDALCFELQGFIDTNKTPQVTACQVKEKLGGLRFYVNGADKNSYNIIKKYEDESFKTCEFCGSKHKVETKGRPYWIRSLCERCSSGD